MREKARQYFKDCNLTYDTLTDENLEYLVVLLNEQLLKQYKQNLKDNKPIYWKSINIPKRKNIFNSRYKDGKRENAFITGKGDYFESREVVSFNANGFIGFCGDASDCNAIPVITAFKEWCDWLKLKEMKG